MPPRAHKPADLTIHQRTSDDNSEPKTSPIGVDLSSFSGPGDANDIGTAYLPPLPQSPPTSPSLSRDQSKGFLSNLKHRISPEQEHRPQIHMKHEDDEAYRPGSSSMSKIYHLKENPGSTPELSLVRSRENNAKQTGEGGHIANPPPLRPETSSQRSEDNTIMKRKEKTFRNPLTRTKSRRDSHSKTKIDTSIKHHQVQPPMTAPLSSDWPDNDLLRVKPKQARGKSAERAIASESDDNDSRPATKDKEKTGFMTGAKNAVRNKTGGNLFSRLGGRMTRSGSSSHDKPATTMDYDQKCKVINLPLVQQTRLTRISKNLDSCRDKTDYLNQHCESEGLYRVPGSHQDIKKWQHRFDTEHDIDLLDEEINDQNSISSMLKAWLRELPTDIMPKDVQDRLAEDLAKQNPDFAKMGQPAPDMLRNALSELSPFNYYLLFAITCHLSLLLSQRDKNKMDLNNLSICIQPALGIDRWLFNYLVGDWRHCWQGCFTEKRFLEHELAVENGEVADDSMMPAQPSAVSSRTDPAYLASMSDRSNGRQFLGADGRAASSGGSASGVSRPASQYEDAISHHDDVGAFPGSVHKTENRVPETYKPAHVNQKDQRFDASSYSHQLASNDQGNRLVDISKLSVAG
nr:putative rho-type gtpase-activating protein 2 [Quercus suber]